MSEPAPPAPAPRRYDGWRIAMLVVGIILLLPGACALFFIIGMASEFRWRDPISQMIAALWGVCLLVSAVGIALIYGARKDAAKPT